MNNISIYELCAKGLHKKPKVNNKPFIIKLGTNVRFARLGLF